MIELTDGWRFELSPLSVSQYAQKSLHIRVFLSESPMGMACWKEYVPHLLGDIVGVIPMRFEQEIINAARYYDESK